MKPRKLRISWPEKICPSTKSSYSKFCKKRSNRLLRRAAKRDPENAPRKTLHRGWTS